MHYQESALSYKLRDIENVWIPMSDGCRLAARIWLPEGAEKAPLPAILEYIPYRKRDFIRLRDQSMHPWFAGNGYAVIRVDMRGSGESDGILHDEYLPQEQEDAVEVIAWIARQTWCSGHVGMMGKSWGAYNSLQALDRREGVAESTGPGAIVCAQSRPFRCGRSHGTGVATFVAPDDRYCVRGNGQFRHSWRLTRGSVARLLRLTGIRQRAPGGTP